MPVDLEFIVNGKPEVTPDEDRQIYENIILLLYFQLFNHIGIRNNCDIEKSLRRV
jgi:hypothetical protein